MACRGIRNGSPFLGSSGDESVDRWLAEESDDWPVISGYEGWRCSTPKPGSPSESLAEGLADLGWQPSEDGIWRLPVAEWSSVEETGGWQKRDSTFEAAKRSNRMIGWRLQTRSHVSANPQ